MDQAGLVTFDDTNDAERLFQDPAMRVVVASQGSDHNAASTHEMGRFEAEAPHYQMRNVHIEWEDICLGRKVKGTGITPKFSLDCSSFAQVAH